MSPEAITAIGGILGGAVALRIRPNRPLVGAYAAWSLSALPALALLPPLPTAAIAVAYSVFQAVPSSFVPQEDEGYFMCIVQAPAGASLEYTTDIAKKAEQIIYADKDVAAAFAVMGFSFAGAAPNNGMIFVRLKDYQERQGKDQSLQAVLQRLSGPLFMVPGAIIAAFPLVLQPGDAFVGLGRREIRIARAIDVLPLLRTLRQAGGPRGRHREPQAQR